MTAPRKLRGTTTTGTGAPEAVQTPAFELTADEMAWAVRFFTLCQRAHPSHRKMALATADVLESLEQKEMRWAAPVLHLVGGGAK